MRSVVSSFDHEASGKVCKTCVKLKVAICFYHGGMPAFVLTSGEIVLLEPSSVYSGLFDRHEFGPQGSDENFDPLHFRASSGSTESPFSQDVSRFTRKRMAGIGLL